MISPKEGWILPRDYVGGTIHYSEINGRKLAYHSGTEFWVQVCQKGKTYYTKYVFRGDFLRAYFHYIGINLGANWNKRLLMIGSHQPIIAKQVGCQ
jgi:hypothetical protein